MSGERKSINNSAEDCRRKSTVERGHEDPYRRRERGEKTGEGEQEIQRKNTYDTRIKPPRTTDTLTREQIDEN